MSDVCHLSVGVLLHGGDQASDSIKTSTGEMTNNLIPDPPIRG